MTQPFSRRQASEPVALTNMRLGLAAMLDCQNAGDGSPRLGLFYGPSGYGKSVAAAYIASRLGGAYVVAKSCWNATSFLKALATEVGIAEVKRTKAEIVAQIIEQLNYDPQPLIIDEMDHLVRSDKPVEIIRDIADDVRSPILMIGEEALPLKLRRWERFDNRVLVAVRAEPSSLADSLLLRDFYCPRVHVSDDLVAAILEATKGVTRRIVTNLQAAQAAAINEGRDVIDLAAWGERRFNVGTGALRKAA